MVTNLQVLAYFWNSLSIKYYLVHFLTKSWASTTNIECMGVLKTVRQSHNETKFQHNFDTF